MLFQVCLPGGRRDKRDTSDIHTALREAKEELGISRSNIEVLGTLPNTRARRKGRIHRVVPVVAVVRRSMFVKLNPTEVRDIFTLPLRACAERLLYEEDGAHVAYYLKSKGLVESDSVYKIWGFTMLLLFVFASQFYKEGGGGEVKSKL